MKGISAVMMIMLTLALIATPCFASDQAAPPAGEKTRETGGKASEDVLRITLKIPLASPLFSDFPIAAVNDDTITVEDLTALLVSSHETKAESKGEKIKMSFSEPLKRLINVKLIIEEARNIGLDELPEIKKSIDTFADAALIQFFIQELVKDVTVDDKEVEPVYRGIVREWKVRSIMFPEKEDARKAEEALKAGAKFDEIAGKALKDGTAYGSEAGAYMKPDSLSPEVLEVVSKMSVGSVSPIIPVGSAKHDYALVKLEEELFREDPAKREEARILTLSAKKNQLLHKTREKLSRKYVTLDKKLNKSLDYDAKKPGMAKLLEDDRILVKIKGEEPILVKDVSRAVNEKFFHGLESAMERKQVSKVKQEVLDEMIGRRVIRKEALLQGIDKTKRYQKLVKEKEETILFGSFVNKVVAPGVKIGDEDIAAYYNKHLADYSYPEMMRLKGLAFDKLRDAESALAKLKKGADWAWVKTNAEGLTDKDAENLLIFDENLLMVTSLSDDVKQALTGAKPGDFRLATGPDGRFYILSVLEVTPSRRQSIEEVSMVVAQTVFNAKLEQSLEEWAAKLKQEARVEIYLVQ
jgi:hypothetical protein